MNWTPEQLDAIGSDQPALLVSAAAGSGKTAVLVARVLRLLKEGGDITRMLIVTFTRAAAAEMRERIAQALEGESANPHLYRQQQNALTRQKVDRATLSRAFKQAQYNLRRLEIARIFQLNEALNQVPAPKTTREYLENKRSLDAFTEEWSIQMEKLDN